MLSEACFYFYVFFAIKPNLECSKIWFLHVFAQNIFTQSTKEAQPWLNPKVPFPWFTMEEDIFLDPVYLLVLSWKFKYVIQSSSPLCWHKNKLNT